ncbi:MAG: 2-oxo acid dehydrogenase subunit E2 [Phototrophicales bacterium]|nr:MAG: 2-oxo acid dehydrogenase subunit E2 [Phototrophicales bacterium]
MTKVIMPQLGESVVEGTVSRWLFQVGDSVKEYDPLLEVSTDKVDTEVSAPASGILLHIYVPEGETVAAGTLLAVIGEKGDPIPEGDDGASAVAHGQSHSTSNESVSAVQQSTNGHAQKAPTRISPVVARMAAEHNLDLSQIQGTGRGGRITKKDVEAFLAKRGGSVVATSTTVVEEDLPPWERPGDGDLFKPTGEFKPTTSAPSTTQVVTPSPMSSPPPTPRAAAPQRVIPVEPIPQGSEGELVPLNNMRRAIAEHMVRSKLQTSPHVTTLMEVDMSAVMAHREAHKAIFAKQGVNLTLTAYFVSAMVTACQTVPILNSQWTDEGIYIHHAVHIGMAVALDEGLIVPVIKHAEQLNLLGIAQRVNDLAERARQKKLKPDEVQGGTISITNHGVSGSLLATPIINQPQAAILGVGMIEKRVKVINDAIAIRPCVYVTLTFDHRIADGATGDYWLMTLKRTLESWA